MFIIDNKGFTHIKLKLITDRTKMGMTIYDPKL